MLKIHKPIIEIINFYASELNDQLIKVIIESQEIKSETEAIHVLEFCNKMFDLAINYEKENKLVLGEPAKVYDAEKTYSVLNDFVADQGFDHLIEDE